MKNLLILSLIILSVKISLCQDGRSFNEDETIEHIQKIFRKDNVWVKDHKDMVFGSEDIGYPFIKVTNNNLNIHTTLTYGAIWIQYYYSFSEKDIRTSRVERTIRIECINSNKDCFEKFSYRTNPVAGWSHTSYASFIELTFQTEANANSFLNAFNHLCSILLKDSNRKKIKDPFDY